MPGVIRIVAKGYRDVLGRFAKRTLILEMERRKAMHAVGREAATEIRRNAPKKTGIFASGIMFRALDEGYTTTAQVISTGEHAFVLNFLRYGTVPHPIPKGGSAEMMAKGYPLRFYWEKGPTGPGIYFFWSVNHPGTDPHPFIDDAMEFVEESALRELRKVVATVVRA
jgi:hypothetical protein